MKPTQTKLGMLLSAVAILLTSQPLEAAEIAVKGVKLTHKGGNLQLQLDTEDKQTQQPQLIVIQDGDTLTANILDGELPLPEGRLFRSRKPLPGISAVEIRETESNGIQVIVKGKANFSKDMISYNDRGISFQVTPESGWLKQLKGWLGKSGQLVSQVPSVEEVIEIPVEVEAEESAQNPTLNEPVQPAVEEPVDQPAQVSPPTPQPIIPSTNPDVLFPNPSITIDGQEIPSSAPLQPVSPAPPFLPRAVPPPVGDIAVGNINAAPEIIDLGTSAVVPRLVLREAPVREVLSLLARSAGLNMVYTGGEETTITLDLENIPIQDAFNTVLQVSGLQANRRGSTLFIGLQLPMSARNLVTRTLRLNQVNADAAATFLATQGASVQVLQQNEEEITDPDTGRVIGRRLEPPSIATISASGSDQNGTTFLLQGMAVSSDARLNTVTLVGEARQIQVATAMLTQLDARKRQVAVNVKIVDIDLAGQENYSSSFSFGIGDTFFSVDGGRATVSQGQLSPPTSGQARNNEFGRPVIDNPLSDQQVFTNGDPNSTGTFEGDEDALLPTSPDTIGTTEGTDTLNLNQAIPNTFLDINGIPRSLQDLIGFGGNLRPLTNSATAGLVPASNDPVTDAPRFFDVNGEARLLSELAGFGQGGTLQPLLQYAVGDLVPATEDLLTTDRTFEIPNLIQYPRDFLAQVQLQVTSGNAKILTDPTLVVQEGQEAVVKLVETVITGVQTQVTGNSGNTTTNPTFGEAGLTLSLNVERIDDNGFITLSAAPTVSSVGQLQSFESGGDQNQISLLNRRELSTGLIRLRDGQTLILSGVIQESDRTTITKVPLLGDLPIIGSLFRDTQTNTDRTEVIIMLTPQVMDDSPESAFGYNYNPGSETREFLRERGFNVPGAR